MAPPLKAQEAIVLGANLLTSKRIVSGFSALWFYDYFLTLSDEIEFAWSGKKTFAFWLFTLNRYWPLWYMIWAFVAYWSPEYTKAMCGKTAWFPMFYFAFATLFAQGAITLRIYAVTGNNRLIAGCLSFMSLVHFAFGMYLSIRFGLGGLLPIPDIPLEEYQVCASQRWQIGEIAYTMISVLYDSAAFLVIAVSGRKRGIVHAVGVPTILGNILKDATIYFLVVFAGQLLEISFDLLKLEQIQTLPASANSVIVPMMITRLMLSLKKAANASRSVWVSNHSSRTVETIRFAQQTIGGAEYGGNIALKDIPPGVRVGWSDGFD